MKLLILGGSSEATQLGRALAGDPRFKATISLAGRTQRPAPQPLPSRRGGFGGPQGLAQYLVAERIDLVIDATHPFATQMKGNAAAAAQAVGIPMLSVQRPEWQPIAGDRWISVGSMAEAAAALGEAPRRVLLTIGQKDLAPFAAAPWHHYVIRSVDRPPSDALPPNREIVTARGPFLESDEHCLLMERRIEIVVTKNSGGSAAAAKLFTARTLGLPVVMVARPPLPPLQVSVVVRSAAEAMDWLAQHHAASSERGA
jgi:precorrin-6A/cobalt-precorrin-6A reductase